MARPIQRSVDYFPLQSNFFEDLKVKRLLSVHGAEGVTLYLYLLCQIYRDRGYYVELGEELLFDAAGMLMSEEQHVGEMISTMLAVGLFDKDRYASYGILTSKGVQDRYRTIKSRSSVRMIPEYAIEVGCGGAGVIAAETQESYCSNNPRPSGIIAAETPVIAAETPVVAAKTPVIATIIPQSKVKERKEKEEVEEEKPASASSPSENKNRGCACVTACPSSQKSESVDVLAEEFKRDEFLMEMCRMKYGMTEKELDTYLDQFKTYLHAIDEHAKIRRDFKPHFLNWLNINIYKDRQRQQDDSALQPVRQPTEEQLSRVRELFPYNNGFLAKSFVKYVNHHRLTPEKALEHFERAHREGWNYAKMLFKIDDLQLIFKD